MKPLLSNDFGKKIPIELVQSISVLPFVKERKAYLATLVERTRLQIVNRNVELVSSQTNGGGRRFWFKCPDCERRVGNLYIHPVSQQVSCRLCLNLDYSKRIYKGMVEDKIINK